jgi:hypothetical protein
MRKLTRSGANAPFWPSATGSVHVWRGAFFTNIGHFRGVLACPLSTKKLREFVANEFGSSDRIRTSALLVNIAVQVGNDHFAVHWMLGTGIPGQRGEKERRVAPVDLNLDE